MTEISDVRYARPSDVGIAYPSSARPDRPGLRPGVTGDLLSTWKQPWLARYVLGLAENGRRAHRASAR